MAEGEDGPATLRWSGKVDESNWQAFADALTAAVEGAALAGAPALRIDLADVPYMSSRGLRALTMARKAAGDGLELVLAGPDARLREIFAISRYDTLFRIEHGG